MNGMVAINSNLFSFFCSKTIPVKIRGAMRRADETTAETIISDSLEVWFSTISIITKRQSPKNSKIANIKKRIAAIGNLIILFSIMIFSSCEWFYISFDGSACFFVVPALSDPFAPLLDNKKCAHEGRIKNAVHHVAKQILTIQSNNTIAR